MADVDEAVHDPATSSAECISLDLYFSCLIDRIGNGIRVEGGYGRIGEEDRQLSK